MSETRNQAYHPSAAVEVKGEYVTLDDYDAALLREGPVSEWDPEIVKGTATRREDLESGQEMAGNVVPH